MFMSLPFDFIQYFQKNLLSKTLLFFYNMCILDFLAVIHIKFFCVKSAIYYRRLFCIFCVSILHIFFSRWYFFQKTFFEKSFSLEIQGVIFLLLFIGVSISYIRFLLSFSSFIIPLAIKNTPLLLSDSVLYVFGENDNDNNTENKVSNKFPQNKTSNEVPQKRFSLFNINYSKNYYRLIKILFKQPRKTILNNILEADKRGSMRIIEADKRGFLSKKLHKIGVSPSDRPENLSIKQIRELSTLF